MRTKHILSSLIDTINTLADPRSKMPSLILSNRLACITALTVTADQTLLPPHDNIMFMQCIILILKTNKQYFGLQRLLCLRMIASLRHLDVSYPVI